MPKKRPRIGFRRKGYQAKLKLKAAKRRAARIEQSRNESTSGLQSHVAPEFFVPKQELIYDSSGLQSESVSEFIVPKQELIYDDSSGVQSEMAFEFIVPKQELIYDSSGVESQSVPDFFVPKQELIYDSSGLQTELAPEFVVPKQEFVYDSSGYVAPVISGNSFDSIRDSRAQLPTVVSDVTIQAEPWFWELPDFGIGHEQSSAAEECSPLVDSSAKEADEYAVILDSVHTYSPNENVDDIVESLKPSFVKNLYNELQNCELPKHWDVMRFENDVAIVQIASPASGCPVFQKSVIVDGNRNVKVYIHDRLLKIYETFLPERTFELQMSQCMKYTVAILRKAVDTLNIVKVCCGNFEDECIYYYEEKVFKKKVAERNCYIERINFHEIVADDCRTKYSRTVRSLNCLFVISNFFRCTNCAKLRNSTRLFEFRTQIAEPCEAIVCSSSDTSFRSLTCEQRKKRLQSLSVALRNEKLLNRMLKQKLQLLRDRTQPDGTSVKIVC